MGLVAGHALVLTWLAEAYDSNGDVATALAHAERAYEIACRYGERGHQAWALRLLGELAGRASPLDGPRAQQYLEHAATLGAELLMRPLIARCRLSLGRLFARMGDRDRAAAELGQREPAIRAARDELLEPPGGGGATGRLTAHVHGVGSSTRQTATSAPNSRASRSI